MPHRSHRLMATCLSQQQLADHWNLSPRTLERWRQVGSGPAYIKVGGQIRYRPDDIDKWERRQRRGEAPSVEPNNLPSGIHGPAKETFATGHAPRDGAL